MYLHKEQEKEEEREIKEAQLIKGGAIKTINTKRNYYGSPMIDPENRTKV